jgi:hypothetical protein
LAWKLRNADLHAIDKANQEPKRKAKLSPLVVALCATADTLAYLDKRLFELPLLECLDKSAAEQAAWINMVTPTVRIAEADDRLITTQRDIRSFFAKRRGPDQCNPAEPGDARGRRSPAEQGDARGRRSPAEQGDAPIPGLRDG